MRLCIAAVLLVSCCAVPHPQDATGSATATATATATASATSVQQTAPNLQQLTDSQFLDVLNGGLGLAGSQQPAQPVESVPQQPQPVESVPQQQQPVESVPQQPQQVESVQQERQPDADVDDTLQELSDAELLAALGVGANQGGLVHCQDQRYTCVPYYLCREDQIVTDGAGLIDIRFGSSRRNDTLDATLTHSECTNFLDVCCKKPVNNTEVKEPYRAQCGRRNDFGVGARIVGFEDGESQFGEFPWMTAVLRLEQIGGELKNLYVCGGALIHPQVVMTAAHCVANNQAGLKVRLGEWDTQLTTELYPHVDVNVTAVEIHENFTSRNLHNDIALLYLEEPVELQEHIDTLCLPDPAVSLDNASCVATGWGKDRFNNGTYQVVLKQVDLERVEHGYCQQQLRTTRLGKFFELDDSFTCAGAPRTAEGEEKEADTCTGDGGSPLACQDPSNPDRYVHGGIVAWGIGCGKVGIPGVYADPQQFVHWIDEKISNYLGLEEPYFGFARNITDTVV